MSATSPSVSRPRAVSIVGCGTGARRAALVALIVASLAGLQSQQVRLEAQTASTLRFFTNYFITGDYVVGGVGLRGLGVNGTATASVTLAGVPEGADILAAFLYWQVVATHPDTGALGARFNGFELRTPDGPIGRVATFQGITPCFNPGGATGPSGPERTYTYRADVLRFFDLGQDGKPVVNGSHQVQLPDSGPNGLNVPMALGATLVVVYRDATRPLNAIVLYDGGVALNNEQRTLTQTLEGFYQPAIDPARRQATISYIVGSGQADKNETLLLPDGGFVASPFSAAAGALWDTWTYPVGIGSGPSVATTIDLNGVQQRDCLTVAAMVFKTGVQDTDGDGLLDVWEAATSASPLFDPNGVALPPLGEMGASPMRKDTFVEIGYMHTGDDALAYGGVVQPAHSHRPSHEVLKLVGDAFKNAPVGNPDGTTGVSIHFDLGADYPEGDAYDPAKNAEEYLVRGHGLARGGESVHEAWSVCERGAEDPPWVCQYQDYPGTIGWKTGFRTFRDGILDDAGYPAPESPGGDDPCDAPGNQCVRRFDQNRQHMFRYALFAHGVGIPKADMPCLDGQGRAAADVNGACGAEHGLTENPDFRVPRSVTGVGDFPGADALITLGAFRDEQGLPVGTVFMQASTLMHELGHTFERRHGGDTGEPNCKPTYLSVMNYLYQLRGLADDLGRPHLDFAREALPGETPLFEDALFDGSVWGLPYRIGWYAPLDGSYLSGNPYVTLARKRCDGTSVIEGERMMRFDAVRAADPIDWNANGRTDDGPLPAQDINFNGRAGDVLAGSDDWSNLRLDQIGARRNVGGLYLDGQGRIGMGPMSIGAGRGDWGRGDWGRGDWGRGDWGRGDWGQGDLPGAEGELDYELATELSKTPPREFRACRNGIDSACTASDFPPHYVRLDWKMPNIGDVDEYLVFRVAGDSDRDGPWELVPGPVQPGAEPGSFFLVDEDSDRLLPNARYTYFAVAQYLEEDPQQPVVRSEPSNQVTVVAINDAPTIGSIPDQTIPMNGSTGALAFTIGDTETMPAGLVLTGSSSNQALVPNAGIVFGGSATSPTLTVSPAPNQTGTATITVTVADRTWPPGQTASTTFTVTVEAPAPTTYTFTGFLSPLATAGSDAQPSNSGTFNFGRTLAVKWRLSRDGTAISDLSSLAGLEAVPGTGTACTGPVSGVPTLTLLDPATGRPTGNSTYRYDAATNQFIFNWDTSAATRSSCYRLRLSLDDGSPPKVTIVRFR